MVRLRTAERRLKLIKLLCRRRHETIINLSKEFNVSVRTIQRDIDEISDNGFYLNNTYQIGTSSVDGTWKNYPYGTKFTQKDYSIYILELEVHWALIQSLPLRFSN